MERDLTENFRLVREGVQSVCNNFGDDYWLARDSDGVFPHEFHGAMAEAGWLGITMPEEYGGAGLGVGEAAVMMNTVAACGAMTAASSVHINMFGPHPILVFGTEEQKQKHIPPIVRGEEKVSFGVTEPNVGLDTTNITTFAEKVDGGYIVNGRKIWNSTAQQATRIMLLARTQKREENKDPTKGITIFYTEFDRKKIEVQLIDKMGRKAVDSNMIFFDDLFIPDEDLIGEEGMGFRYILHAMNPERILVGAEGVGIGQDALRRASKYALEREVFGRPIGMNQGIQHPLAENWMELEAAWLMCVKAAELFDAGQSCGAEANASKFLGAKAGYNAAMQAVMTHGGMGYAKEYHVERLMREVMITRIAPVSEQLIASFIAERVLGLPKSY
jgi:acyl-CoA dehydrogenase